MAQRESSGRDVDRFSLVMSSGRCYFKCGGNGAEGEGTSDYPGFSEQDDGDWRSSQENALPDCSCSEPAATTSAPTTAPSHLIVAGNYAHSQFTDISVAECVEDSTVTTTVSDIAVSCCDDNGGGFRSFSGEFAGCQRATTFDEAKAICDSNGYRLCTMEEMLSQQTQGKGCSHDSRYNWVSDACGCEQETPSSHFVAPGNPSNGKWDGQPIVECVEDSSVTASDGTAKFGNDIAVSCCSDSAGAIRDISGCQMAKSYAEAAAICEGAGSEYRLCTLGEMLSGKTKGKGCSHDARYNWVSNECGSCDDSTNALAAQSGSAVMGDHSAVNEAANADTRSFDDYIPTVAGAAFGALVIAVIVAAIMKMRRRRKESERDLEGAHDAVVSASMELDGPETTGTVIEMR